MAVIYNLGSIIKGLEATYVLQRVKVIFERDDLYMVSQVGAYDSYKSFVLNEEEIYPYLSAEGYIGKVIPVVDFLYDLSKYLSKSLIPRD